VTSEGAIWKAHRGLLSPAFHFAALERLQSLFVRTADRLTEHLMYSCNRSGSQSLRVPDTSVIPTGNGSALLDLSAVFRKVTLEVISEVALGLNPDNASVFPKLFEQVLDELNVRVFQPWRVFFPSNKEHQERLEKLNNIVYEIIKSRRALRAADPNAHPSKVISAEEAVAKNDAEGGTAEGDLAGSGIGLNGKPIFGGGGDMLDMMLDSGVEWSDQQLADEVKTQLLAGHETSSMMLTWSCYLLARHPEVLAKAVAEVDSSIGLANGVTKSSVATAKANPEPTLEQYKNLEFLGWVLKEAMRLYSPVPVLTRATVEDDPDLGGFFVPKDTTVMISIWAMHTSKEIWGQDADKFRPERFSDVESRSRHAFAYLPFSQGPRNCIGQNLAIMEAKVVLAQLLRLFTLSLEPGQPEPETDDFVIPVRPKRRLRIVIEPRK
jgi:cytochrome P450